jgi:SAM-dependent methyltransferase
MYWLGKWIYHLLNQAGLDPLRLLRSAAGLPAHVRNFFAFRARMPAGQREFAWGAWMPCPGDRFETSGTARGHYFHQDLWAAQRIFKNRPRRHVDVGSRLDGFVAHVAAFRALEVFDVRAQTASVRNVTFRQADLAAEPFRFRNHCDSVSCLSVLEHIGLGRYGDSVDYAGHQKAWAHLHQLLRPGGVLYFSVPIGPSRIEFDAHRVFSLASLSAWFEGTYRLRAFAYVNDAGNLVEPKTWSRADWEKNFGCRFGCGLFELQKIAKQRVKKS